MFAILSDMQTIVTTKGQVVIPAAIRRKYGIKTGTKLVVIDEDDRIVLKPITEEYYRSLRGALKGKGVLKVLLAERAKDKEREDGRR